MSEPKPTQYARPKPSGGGDVFMSLISAGLFLYVGFGLGLEGISDSAIYNGSVTAFVWGARIVGIGLLVTSHRSVGLPEVFRTQVDTELGRRIVAELLDGEATILSSEEIDDCVNRHGQNLREALFELYDLFEQRRRE